MRPATAGRPHTQAGGGGATDRQLGAPDRAPAWPAVLSPGKGWHALSGPGLGRASAIEILVNAVLPVALASGAWPLDDVESFFFGLSHPRGTYGLLRPLERWLTAGKKPLDTAARLQGGLRLQSDYCARGLYGRCPFSTVGP